MTVRRAGSGDPVSGAPVHVALLEGGVPRFEVRVVTDASGGAMTRVPIPRSTDPAWTWTLEAQALGQGTATASVTLVPREETPGTPRLHVAWREPAVHAGDHASFFIDVRDATDQPVAGLPVRYWLGPEGTRPPKDEPGWLAASTLALTSAAGEILGGADTPSTVVQGVGTTLQLVARTSVDGHDLAGESIVHVGAGAATAEILPEAHEIVPGVEQRLLLRVLDGHARPIAGPFLVEGDGLHQEVHTDAWGEAELAWKVPPDVGATRNVGPCAGGVAASVRVRATAEVPQLLPAQGSLRAVPLRRSRGGGHRPRRSLGRAHRRERPRHRHAREAERRSEGPRPGPRALERPHDLGERRERGERVDGGWREGRRSHPAAGRDGRLSAQRRDARGAARGARAGREAPGHAARAAQAPRGARGRTGGAGRGRWTSTSRSPTSEARRSPGRCPP